MYLKQKPYQHKLIHLHENQACSDIHCTNKQRSYHKHFHHLHILLLDKKWFFLIRLLKKTFTLQLLSLNSTLYTFVVQIMSTLTAYFTN